MELNDLSTAAVGLLSAVIVALITQGGQWLREKSGRKDSFKTRLTEIVEMVKALGERIDNIEYRQEEKQAIDSRNRILRFADELIDGKTHTKEHYDSVLIDCDFYEHYCDTHPNFANNVTMHTINYIEATYDKLLKERKFKNDRQEDNHD